MYKRVKIINKYYNNLTIRYDEDNKKREALEKISTLSKELNFKDIDKMPHRFFHTASLIEKYLNLFKSVCEHVDVVTTIINYLHHFAASVTLDVTGNEHMESVISIMLTINSMHIENEMLLFLERAIIPESQMMVYYEYKNIALQHLEMILLEDSDLYAVINCLKIRDVIHNLDKIWVQESIVQTFKWHFKKCFKYLDISIHIFRSKQELVNNFNTYECNIYMITELNIVSIWSEDVVAAKNLAESLNQDIIFINTHMEFCPGIIFPYINVHCKSLHESFNLSQIDKYTYTTSINPTVHKGLIYDLFYDGKWQLANTYWIHNNILLANATRKDIMNCAESAIDGFKIWSTMSNDSRLQLLFKFANTLECNGEFILSKIILSWLKMSYICGRLIYSYQNERFEVMKVRKPQGTVILKEKDKITLFRELIQSLIVGNSVIIICNPDLCTLARYCDMFKISGIPSGVINLLSSENTDFRYDIIMNSTVNTVYNAVTIIKHIILSHN